MTHIYYDEQTCEIFIDKGTKQYKIDADDASHFEIALIQSSELVKRIINELEAI